MKQLFVLVTTTVTLLAFFVVVPKEFSRYDDVQTLQKETPVPNENPFISTVAIKPFADINNSSPVAVPLITPEEAIKINEEAIKYYRTEEKFAETKETKTISGTIDGMKAAPAAVPLLTSDEAIEANKVAMRFYNDLVTKERTQKIIYGLQSFFKKYFILFILGLIALVSETFIILDPKKDNKKKTTKTERIVESVIPITLLLFNIMIFIPWSVFLRNASNFTFVLSEFFCMNLVAFFVLLSVLVVILYFIPEKIRGYLTAGITGIGLCFYFQSMFMNVNIGIMNGTEPNWAEHRLWGIINLIIWGIVAFLPLFIKKRYSSHWQTITWLSATVLGLEFIAILSQASSASKNVWFHKQSSYCEASNQFQLSKEKNVLVFIFDALSSDFTKQCFESSPDLKEAMKDFTWYTDAYSNYSITAFALTHELTGSFYLNPAKNQEQLYDNLWHSVPSKSFYNQIHNAGYDSRIYVRTSFIVFDMISDLFSNIKDVETIYNVNKIKLCQCLATISGYSSVPFLFKRFFFYGDDLSNDVVQQNVKSDSSGPTIPPVKENDRLYDKMISGGISTDAASPVLSIHYTWGAHKPWRVDEKCRNHGNILDSFLPPTTSCYYFISELIRLLKENQIYDQTSILICSDHGHPAVPGCSTSAINSMTFMVKPFFANNQEIKMDNSNVQSIDILPTLLQLACGNEADFSGFDGFPASNIPPDRKRTAYRERYDIHFDDLTGLDGNPLSFNCLHEFDVDLKTKINVFSRIIPLKAHDKKE